MTDKFKAYSVNGYTNVTWYDGFGPEGKLFIYPHILVSYVASEWYRPDNMEYIIMGEAPEQIPCENIGVDDVYCVSSHADEGYGRIKNLVPDALIIACGGSWDCLLDYIVKNPDIMIMASCAYDWLGWETQEEKQEDPYYRAFRDVLESDNVIVSCAGGKIIGSVKVTLEENTTLNPFPYIGAYSSASVTSYKNNKYTVSAYVPYQENIFLDNLATRPFVGFGKGNMVVPFVAGVSLDGYEDTSIHASYPTAAFSATLGNFLSILLKTHPGITLEGASTIMQENYFRAEKMKYKDDDGVVKEGGDWHFFKTDEFIASEILQKNAVDAAFSSSAQEIDLPSSGGLCYIGPGIQFEVDGTAYEMTETNRGTLTSALAAGKEIIWTFDRELAEKYATGTADITVRIFDHAGELIPDITRVVGVGI